MRLKNHPGLMFEFAAKQRGDRTNRNTETLGSKPDSLDEATSDFYLGQNQLSRRSSHCFPRVAHLQLAGPNIKFATGLVSLKEPEPTAKFSAAFAA